MKKLFAVLLVLAVIFSLGTAALATGEEPVPPPTTPNGKIIITNPTLGEEYSIYKIFDASYSGTTTAGKPSAVSYRIHSNNQFFTTLFGIDGETENTYFTYDKDNGAVAKRATVNDTDLVNYLTGLVTAEGNTFNPDETIKFTAGDTVEFTGLDYGYYVVKSTMGTAVTITSNTPTAEVIDKNQHPGHLVKTVYAGRDSTGEEIWTHENTADIGDIIQYKVAFDATNYDGENKLVAYQVDDENGEAIWIDFNSFQVTVNGEPLTKGYFLNQTNDAVANLTNLGGWTGSMNEAEWYLSYTGADSFRVTIPWNDNHSVGDATGALAGENNNNKYKLISDYDAPHLYDSPAEVVITYNALVETNATLGLVESTNLFNRAKLTWLSELDIHGTDFSRVNTRTYALGIQKEDASNKANLPGAQFRLYSSVVYDENNDVESETPVYVIPTNVEGVYVVDSLNSNAVNIVGATRVARSQYAAYLDEYRAEGKQDNIVITPANGKVVILGLQEGTYYLKETKAPEGYNPMSGYKAATLNKDYQKTFTIFVDGTGHVANITQAEGEFAQRDYLATEVIVQNSQGAELPSTGGETAMKLIVFGSILAIGFAVLLVTQKKMSVYKD